MGCDVRNDVITKRQLRQLVRKELERTDLKALVHEAIKGMNFQTIVQKAVHEVLSEQSNMKHAVPILRCEKYRAKLTSSKGPAQQRVLH